MDGTAQVVAKLLYGSGLRIMEAVRLRVKDIDYQMKQLTVRKGKDDKDWFTTFPAILMPLLQNHLAGVKTLHQQITRARTISVCIWSRWCSTSRATASTPQPCWGKIAFEFPKHASSFTDMSWCPQSVLIMSTPAPACCVMYPMS